METLIALGVLVLIFGSSGGVAIAALLIIFLGGIAKSNKRKRRKRTNGGCLYGILSVLCVPLAILSALCDAGKPRRRRRRNRW